LTFNGLPSHIQRLRCKVNFEALNFVPHIKELGNIIVQRLRYNATINQAEERDYLLEETDKLGKQQNGKFVVLHLRFDKVLSSLAFLPGFKKLWVTCHSNFILKVLLLDCDFNIIC
jgi:hypothetical protein